MKRLKPLKSQFKPETVYPKGPLSKPSELPPLTGLKRTAISPDLPLTTPTTQPTST